MRERRLTSDEVGEMVNRRIDALFECYARERLNSPDLSSYVFELEIPNDGTHHVVRRLHASKEGQEFLEQCLTSVLRALRFPAHTGPALLVQVPIEPGER